MKMDVDGSVILWLGLGVPCPLTAEILKGQCLALSICNGHVEYLSV
jgi:hypothetical protein